MSLSQTSLEDAYGGKPFGTRTKVQEHFTEQDENEKKKKAVVESVLASLPLEKPIPPPILYVFTGVFFLFTFDTFVMMGKGMRKKA